MNDPIRRFLRSELAWRLSGLTFPTAVAATNGRVRTLSEYLELTRSHMAPLLRWFPLGGTFLEFGSGLGGNLFAVAPRAKSAYGLDINPHYVRIAKGIARRLGLANVAFRSYNGVIVPAVGPEFDVVFSMGVFERVPHDRAAGYVSGLVAQLRPGGSAVLYFLSPSALATTFVRRLGAEAYAPWNRGQVISLLEGRGLTVVDTVPFKTFPLREGAGGASVGDFYIGTKAAT
jgi:SAM-dependent methyltransferase